MLKSNSGSIIQLILKDLKVKANSSTIFNKLHSLPQENSLFILSECLKHFGVDSYGFIVDIKDYYSKELKFPCIAHLNDRGGMFIVIHDIKDEEIYYSTENVSRGIILERDFLIRWSGIILHAEANTISGENNYIINKIKELFSSLVIGSLILLCLGIILWWTQLNHFSWPFIALLAIKKTGLMISILLLTYTVNFESPIIQQICNLSKHGDCNAILQSKASKLTTWLSWSEVGFFYFAGSTISLMINPDSFWVLQLLNLLTLPYTFYSVWYQFKSKSWCQLCCSIQLIFWIEFIIYSTNKNIASNLGVNKMADIRLIFISFLLPVLSWAFMKPFFLKSNRLNSVEDQLRKFKFNTHLFNQVLTNQPLYDVDEELKPILLGNQGAKNIITMVSNPFCQPCSRVHFFLHTWLKESDDIKLKIIFTRPHSNDNYKNQVSNHISALCLLDDQKLIETALNDWYGQKTKDYQTWAQLYPVPSDPSINGLRKKQIAWCDMTEITFTPTILINGYKLPQPYSLEDVKILLR